MRTYHMPKILVSLSVCLACNVVFKWRASQLDYAGVLDARLCYSREAVLALFHQLCDGRSLYLVTELTVDMIFPLAYAYFLSKAAAWITKGNPTWLGWLPWIAAGIDIIENLIISSALHAFDPQALEPSIGAIVVPYVTLAKYITLMLFAVVTLVLVYYQLIKAKRLVVTDQGGYTVL